MPNWYFGKDGLLRTPSRLDGIDYPTELRYRREGTRFIMNCGNKMGLRYDTMATGAVYFHRFYMIQSFKNFPRWVTGAACLFLAGKVEETPKKCRDIIKTARTLLPDPQFEVFGEDPREEVMTYERVLLQTIKFDLQVDHPYQNLLKFGKALKGDREKLNKLVQMAWTFTNDSLSTTLCLIYKPEVIAVAMLVLAAKFTSYDLQSSAINQGKPWYSSFVKMASDSMVTEITDLMLELYGGGGKKREKERMEPSDQRGNLFSSSSPLANYSPPVKRKKTGSTSTDGKVQSSAPETKADVKQTNKAPSQPPLPQTASTQLQVENISPAVTPSHPQTHAQVAAATEPPKVVQSVDTTFTATIPTNTNINPPPSNTSANHVAPVSTYVYPTTAAYITTAQNYALSTSLLQPSVLPASGLTYPSTMEYNPRGMASLQVPVPFQAQSYLPPSQGYGQTAQYPLAQHLPQSVTSFSAPPPLGLTSNTSVYPLPPGSLGTHQNPPNFGLPQGHGAPHTLSGLPPPPLPPLHSRQPLPQHPGSREAPSDYQWPRGWMR